MVKKILILPYLGILISNKEEETVDIHNNLSDSAGKYNILSYKKPIPKVTV